MSWTRRLPSGDLLVDLRPANPPDVVDGSVFLEVAHDLDASDLRPRLRVWVLHDAATQWCADASQLERGLRAWLGAAAHGAMEADGMDVVVLPPVAARNGDLIAAIQELGLAVHTVRRGGGLPLNTIELDGDRMTAVTSQPMPPGRLSPGLQGALAQVLDG